MPQPKPWLPLGLGGGGCDGDGEGDEGEGGHSRFDRHEKLHPVGGGPLWSAYQLDGTSSNPVRLALD